jgi:hypothetical protein
MYTDHLYTLLPAVYRSRDVERGYPLQALLRVIAEQAGVVEDDIRQLYENWFIETCEEWVVPYLGDLIGWRQVHEAGEPGGAGTARGQVRNKFLTSRRELANTIRFRHRKGTLALLEELANAVAGWPARAVEFFTLLGWTQNLNLPHFDRGRTVDLRRGAALDLMDGPFEELSHTVDVRRVNSQRASGRYNIPSVGLFVCRLRSYSVTRAPAFCVEEVGPQCFSFSVLGNDAPLFTRVERESDPTSIAAAINLPVAIDRRAFEVRTSENGRVKTQASEVYYGDKKSLSILVPKERRDRKERQDKTRDLQMIPATNVIPADLSQWSYRPPRDHVAVDPTLGRIVFPLGQLPKEGVWVTYHYGFSMDIGGGEYGRPLSQPTEHKLYRVGMGEQLTRINEALSQWQDHDRKEHPHAVIEITDSGVYVEQINITLGEKQSLQLRAANRRCPVIRLLDWHTERPDALSVTGARGSRFTLDGILVTGRSVMIDGEIAEVAIRHSTLVPGWALDYECEPHRPAEPSLELFCPDAHVSIEHSIVGSIQVHPLTPAIEEPTETKRRVRSAAVEAGCGGIGHGFRVDPMCLHISDSIIDATDPEKEAIGAPGCPVAHARLTILRCTVFGQVQAHAIDLGENSLFVGKITVARRQHGCLRFCYVTPGSRTPRRYHCQPDLVEQVVEEELRTKTNAEQDAAQETTRKRERDVRPRFQSVRYGNASYCRLADACADEITRGADDESEMGVFHDLCQPQRTANLRARLDEYMPAGMDAGIIFIN